MIVDAAREPDDPGRVWPGQPHGFHRRITTVSSDEPETPVMVEALINYWAPIGINVTLLDNDWGTVRKEFARSQGRMRSRRAVMAT